MNLRRVLKEFLVQQISVSDGRVFLLFHPQSPVKVEKLLELINKPKQPLPISAGRPVVVFTEKPRMGTVGGGSG